MPLPAAALIRRVSPEQQPQCGGAEQDQIRELAGRVRELQQCHVGHQDDRHEQYAVDPAVIPEHVV